MDLGVSGKSYIIVGGTKGMGWAAATFLAKDGGNVALIGRNGAYASERADELAGRYQIRAKGYAADASKEGEVERAIAAAIGDFGKIRGLLTTPGSTNFNGTILQASDKDWQINFNDVLMSQVRSCKAILPHLLDQGGGNLVTTAAYSARAAKDFLFPYATFKAGLTNFTKNLAKTYGAQGVRANCICPGAIETDVLQTRRKDAAKQYNMPVEKALEHVMFTEWKMPVATKRIGTPEEVGDMMAYLLSERSGYMTGATINIDGGTDF